jgi:uncharacterized protein (DUF1015 family)
MAHVKPFAAFRYNQGKIDNLSKVICPPYDIISFKKQQYLHDMHPNNFIHVDFARDIPEDDKYSRSARCLEDWIKKDILVRDEKPSVYFYSHQYWINREKKVRFGFIALLKLDEKKGSVFGHEHTRLEPKEDRLKLMNVTQANLSPIFVVFSDKKRLVNNLWNNTVSHKKPIMDIADEDKNTHKIWRIDDQRTLDKIAVSMEEERMFIADGHHRYEVACAYRDEMKKKKTETFQEEGFNFIMAYFTNIDPVGLTILPIHRLVKVPHKPDMDALAEALAEHFFVVEHKDKTRFFFLLEKAGRVEHVIGMYNDDRFWLLRLKNIKVIDKVIIDKPLEYRRLDVSILNALILKKTLKLDLEDKSKILFIPEKEELIGRVDKDNSYIAFFLNPTKIDQIVSVALAGEKMPPKSTYFFPKPVSGLVINKHD